MSNLAAALLAAQKAMPAIHKDSKAEVPTKSGGKFSYTYLSLQALLETVLPVLNDAGLALSQMPSLKDGREVLTTTLFHGASGETLAGDTPLILSGPQTPQTWGGAITYARRYALTALLGIAADDDDDGAEASKPRAQARTGGRASQSRPSTSGNADAGGGITASDPDPPVQDAETLQRYLADIDTFLDALAVAKGNDKTAWVKAVDESAPSGWRSDVTGAAMVLAKVKRWAAQSKVKVAA